MNKDVLLPYLRPETVLHGPKIWPGEWGEKRAAAHKSSTDGLEKHHQRSLLERSVYPGDVAEVVYFLASELSAKSSGNILNVDAGNAASFPT